MDGSTFQHHFQVRWLQNHEWKQARLEILWVFLEPITELLEKEAPPLWGGGPLFWYPNIQINDVISPKEVLFLDDDETPMPDIIWGYWVVLNLSWLIANLCVYFFPNDNKHERRSVISFSSLYHWIDLRVWILLEKTVLCFLDSSVCCGTYLWFVQAFVVALWVFQSMRKLDLILLIHLVWRLGGCFTTRSFPYLCGCDSHSAGKLCPSFSPKTALDIGELEFEIIGWYILFVVVV